MNPQDQLPVLNPCKKSRRLTVGCSTGDSPGSDVPCLRLRGRWLKDAGFAIGRNVKIEVSEGRLMIEPVDRSSAPGKIDAHSHAANTFNLPA